MARVTYVRVSTKEQHTDRQEIQMKDLSIDEMFVDKLSGKNTDRPEFQRMMAYVRTGDEVIVSSLDRLGRNYDDIKATLAQLNDKGVTLNILDAQFLRFNTGNKILDKAMFDMFLSLLSYIATNEREKMLARQRGGIAAAKTHGNVYLGKQVEYSATSSDKKKRAIYFNVVDDLQTGIAVLAISKKYDIHRKTVYRIKHELEGEDVV